MLHDLALVTVCMNQRESTMHVVTDKCYVMGLVSKFHQAYIAYANFIYHGVAEI